MAHVIYTGSSGDAGAALVAVASAMARHGVAADDRAPYLAAVARGLRACRDGAIVRVALNGSRLETVIDAGTPVVAAAHGPAGGPDGAGGPGVPWADLLAHLVEQHDLLDGYRTEIEQTNRGVVALHAELADNEERLRRASRLQQQSLRAERRARAAAEAARSRLAFLAHAGATLSESLAHETVLARLRDLVVPRFARSLTVWLARGAVLDPFPPAEASSAPSEYVEKAYVSGRVQHATPFAADANAITDMDIDVTPSGRPLLAVPLVSNGVTRGVLAAEPLAPAFTDEDVMLFGELGRLTAGAIDNALRYEHERDVAERLQRAMLTDLPGTGRLAFTARYLPAEAGLNVGGDWYDAFERPDGDVIAAVGDVTGHGLQAAALMGQLRTALRAYALEADGPGHVLTCMHRMLSHLQPEDLATAVLAQWSPDGRLRWANAGHPPPLLRAPDGTVTALDDHGFLLGMPFEGAAQAEHSTVLAPGSAVLFYTDGLIERRGAPLDAGIERLAAAFAAATGALDDVADEVLDAMLSDSTREDDTCLLIFRNT